MVKNYIFYHCTTLNDYYDRFLKTYSKIQKSELIKYTDKFFVFINGESGKNFNLDNKINIYQNKLHPNESITINKLRDFCIDNKDCNILYLHCKGITKSKNEIENVNAWIDSMEYFLIERHKQCIEDLKIFNAVGSFLKTSPNLHFSGNFWWATSNYISTLDKCIDNYYAPEMWHLSKCEKQKAKCYFNTLKNLYNQKIERYEYEF